MLWTFVSVGQSLPSAHSLAVSPYHFSYWSPNSIPGEYPSSTVFQVYDSESEPKIDSEPIGDWLCVYDIDSRSRFIGLGEQGIGMINTGDVQDDASRCGADATSGKVGAVVVGLNTEGVENVQLQWNIGMLENGNGYPYPRVHHVIVEYQIGIGGGWRSLGREYVFSTENRENGEFEAYFVELPAECDDQPYIQLRWRYYQEESNNGGSRALIAIDDIKIFEKTKTYIFLERETIEEINCVEGKFSAVDSIKFSFLNLEENLRITSSGNYYISMNKEGEFSQEILIDKYESFADRVLYIKKKCENLSIERKDLVFTSGALSKVVKLAGRGYAQVYINEVVSSNFMSYYDGRTKSYPDWIELYNPNEETVRIWDWYLSDSRNNLTKTIIKRAAANNLSPHQHKIFIAYGDENPSPAHLNFKLSSYGEAVFLVGPDGKTIVDSVTVVDLESDVSYGRRLDGDNEWIKFSETTPEASNNTAKEYLEKSDPPTFSHHGGYYDEPFKLSLTADHPEAKVYYTLDGSEPDPNNLGGAVYEYKQSYANKAEHAPYTGQSFYRPYRTFLYYDGLDLSLHQDKFFWMGDINGVKNFNAFIPEKKRSHAIIIKAVRVDPGKQASEPISHTYFFNQDDLNQDSLPVISLTLNERDLKGFYEGIGVPGVDYETWRNIAEIETNAKSPSNYNRRGREAEIQANMELLANGKQAVNQKVGIRIHGNWSRSSRHKSFRVYARKKYEKNKISYPFFPNLPYEDFNRVLLRNSGNDYLNVFFRDAFVQRLLDFTGMDNQEYNPFVIYINGEYWGMLNAREKIDVKYLQRKYGFEDKDVDLLSKTRDVESGSRTSYEEMLSNLDEQDANGTVFYEYANDQIDIENYIDYQALKTYSAETDWPGNNIKYWRYRNVKPNQLAPYGLDGKWRWIDFDNDSGFKHFKISHNSLDWATEETVLNADEEEVDNISTFLFRTLLKNNQFKTQFITRYSDLLNTAFLPSRIIPLIDSFQNLIEHDMQNQIVRWGAFPKNGMQGWYAEVDSLRSFARQRHPILYDHIRDFFELGDTSKVFLDVDDYQKGWVKINTVEINDKMPGVDSLQPYPWSGKYFDGLPISFIPIPRDGYKFSRWELKDSISYIDTLVFDLKRDVHIKAYFEIDDNYIYDPEPAIIADCPFEFTEWARKHEIGVMPEHMAFYHTRFPDSRANGPLDGKLDSIRYDHTSKTRINGLEYMGLSLINTNGANANYYQTRLGATAVAFSTENIPAAEVSFTAGTVFPKSKKYSIRLQYRLSDKGEVFDFYDKNGKLVEYHGSTEEGHEQRFESIELPSELLNKKYVQLHWRYYFNGQQVDMGSDARDELRIDDIIIRQKNIIGSKQADTYSTTLLGNPHGQRYQWFQCEDDSLKLLENQTNKDLLITQPGWYALEVQYDSCATMSSCEYFFLKEFRDYVSGIEASIIPNPTDGNFELVFEEPLKDIEVVMTDMSGKVINVRKINEVQRVNYHMSNLAGGMYFLKISDKYGQHRTEKVIIQ